MPASIYCQMTPGVGSHNCPRSELWLSVIFVIISSLSWAESPHPSRPEHAAHGRRKSRGSARQCHQLALGQEDGLGATSPSHWLWWVKHPYLFSETFICLNSCLPPAAHRDDSLSTCRWREAYSCWTAAPMSFTPNHYALTRESHWRDGE